MQSTYWFGSLGFQAGGLGGRRPGAPQQIIPQVALIGLAVNVKSGVTPVAVAKLEVPMLQRSPGTASQMSLGRLLMRTVTTVPSQLKCVSRVWDTRFWAAASMRISTYCADGSPPRPIATSSMFAMWNSADPGVGVIRSRSDATNAANRDMDPSQERGSGVTTAARSYRSPHG